MPTLSRDSLDGQRKLMSPRTVSPDGEVPTRRGASEGPLGLSGDTLLPSPVFKLEITFFSSRLIDLHADGTTCHDGSEVQDMENVHTCTLHIYSTYILIG